MSEKKFIPTDFTWGSAGLAIRLLGFWADSNVWDSYDPLHGIRFLYINLKTGNVAEDIVHSETHSKIEKAIMTELVKVFPKPIPKREIGLTVEEIGEIIAGYTKAHNPKNWCDGSDHKTLRNILDRMNLIPKTDKI